MRRAQTTLAGQARIASTLGVTDPRFRRRAQGFSGNQDFYVGFGLTKDGKGRLAVDVNQIASAICTICDTGGGGGDPDPTCDPIVDPCGCCPSGLVCDEITGLCEDPSGNCSVKLINYCATKGIFGCNNGVCAGFGESVSASNGDGEAMAWLGF